LQPISAGDFRTRQGDAVDAGNGPRAGCSPTQIPTLRFQSSDRQRTDPARGRSRSADTVPGVRSSTTTEERSFLNEAEPLLVSCRSRLVRRLPGGSKVGEPRLAMAAQLRPPACTGNRSSAASTSNRALSGDRSSVRSPIYFARSWARHFLTFFWCLGLWGPS